MKQKAFLFGVIHLVCLSALFSATRTASGQGAVIFDPANRHYYQALSGDMPWTSARDSAANITYMGSQGHLATISSAEENNFIYSLVYSRFFTNYPGITGKGDWVWLGGYQPDGSLEPAGSWTWVTGESFDYTNWDSGQPSDSQGGGLAQNFLLMWHGGSWNDAAGPFNGNDVSGFIVEFEPVPEPCTTALLGVSGLAGWFVKRRRRQRF
jgi:hypothetical protein